MIEVEHLRKEYGDVVAVDDVSFHVGKGEVLGFLGPNAAGKTTTMRMLTGYLFPTAGTARLAGFDIMDDPLAARRHIGYLPENVPLYDEMTVGRYLAFAAQVRDVPSRKISNRVDEVMAAVHITERRSQSISKLSKGLRQRVGIAQAMIHNPDVLILDEPTVGLDPQQVIEVRELIRKIGRDHTIILSTHILSEASMVCDRVVIINHGRILAEDTPQALTRRLLQGQQVEVIVRGPRDSVLPILQSLPGVSEVRIAGDSNGARKTRNLGLGDEEIQDAPETSSQDEASYLVRTESNQDIRPAIAYRVIQNGWDLLGLAPVRLSLEEIFLRVTGTDSLATDSLANDSAAVPTLAH